MSILGTVVRIRPEDLDAVVSQLAALPGTDLALNPGDGRLVVVIEDVEVDGKVQAAAATMAGIALWPQVLNLSLVYEYSGPDSPAPANTATLDYRAWRGSLADMATQQP